MSDDTNKVVNQHYVPRTYLKKFTSDGTETGNLYTYDKIEDKIFPWNVSEAASTDYFYDLSDEQEVEKLLGRLEGLFTTARDRLLQIRDLEKMDNDEILNIAYFLVFQDLRTRGVREKIMDMSEYFLGKDTVTDPETEWETQVREFINNNTTEHGAKRFQLQLIAYAVTEFVRSLDGERWILFDNTTNTPYWTSDHPVVRYNPLRPNRLHNPGILGIGGEGYQIHLPLSPDLTLSVCDIDSYYMWDNYYKVEESDKVKFRNKLQVIQSWRQVYSPDDNLDYAKKVANDPQNFPDSEDEEFQGVF